MNSVIERFSKNDIRYNDLFDVAQIKKQTFEESVKGLYIPYIGKSAYQIGQELNFRSEAKSYYHGLSNRIL